MNPLIRLANPEESSAIAQLVNSAYRGDSSRKGWTTEADLLDGQRTDGDAILELLRSPSHALLIAADSEGAPLLGSVLLERRAEGLGYLGMLTVSPGLQARGLGRKLLAAGEEFVKSRWGCRRIEMTVIRGREELIQWYIRRGYLLTGERRPFPADDPRSGIVRVERLEFEVLRKDL